MDYSIFTKDYFHQKEYVEKRLAAGHFPLGAKAYEFAKERHLGQFRKDGSPYIVHLVEVVYYLFLIKFDDDISIAAGFSHDGPEDGKMTRAEVVELLTETVDYLVFIVTKPKKNMTTEEKRKHFVNIFGEIRTLVMKIIDRVANMKRSMIGFFDKEKLQRYCDDAEYIIVPMLEGFIAVIEDMDLAGGQYQRYYGRYSKSLRLLRSFLKGFLQAGREHIKLMAENEKLIE